MKRTRWFWLSGSLAILGVAFAQGKWVEVLVAFGLGVGGGCLIELFAMKLRLWTYSYQPFSRQYFPVVGTAWGCVGIMVNLPWDWMETPSWVTFIVLTLGFLLIWEVPNLVIKSWKYREPSWLVIMGWFPLVAAFRGAFLVVS